MSLPDRWRNLGPTDVELFAPAERRSKAFKDGLKPVYISQGVAQNANGSSYLETDSCRLQCVVHGPQPQKSDAEGPCTIEVNVNVEPYAGIADKEFLENAVADFVKTTVAPAIVLESYPRTQFTIAVVVLAAGGELETMAAAANVATLALVNAGVALNDMATAVTVAMHNGQIYADVDADQGDHRLVASFFCAEGRLASVSVRSRSSLERDVLEKMLSKAATAANELRKLHNSYLVEDYANK